MDREEYTITIHMDSYIAEPYWPELDELINIEKKSGINRLKNESKRDSALKAYLEREGMDLGHYHNLQQLSRRKWYMDEQGKIIIPRHHLAGALVQAVGSAPSAVRGKFGKDSFRHYVQIGDFVTDKTERDEVFDRYIKNEATNQRRRSVSEVIKDFDAVGKIALDTKFEIKDLGRIITHALRDTGVGACRKMGYGRGEVLEIASVD